MVTAEQKQTGYIALLAILIVGAIALAISLTLLASGTDRQREVFIQQQSTQARDLASSCAEEALQLIHDTTSYTGSGSLTLGTGSCTYSVTSTGATTRSLSTTGTVGSVVRKLQVYVTIGSSSVSITSWQEIS